MTGHAKPSLLRLRYKTLPGREIGTFAGDGRRPLGATRVLLIGGVLYALGLAGMASAPSPSLFLLEHGVLIGAAQAGTACTVIFGVIGRQIDPSKRSWAMGMTSAAGSSGQFLMVYRGLSHHFLRLAARFIYSCRSGFVHDSFGVLLREPASATQRIPSHPAQSLGSAIPGSLGLPQLFTVDGRGVFCGFQVVFIGVHMPAYLKDHGLAPEVASYALALIAWPIFSAPIPPGCWDSA